MSGVLETLFLLAPVKVIVTLHKKEGTVGIQPSRSTASDIKDKRGGLGSHVIQGFRVNDQSGPSDFKTYGFTSTIFCHK